MRNFSLLLCVLVGLLVPLTAFAVEYGNIAVSVESPVGTEFTHGYAEFRVSITNRSLSTAHDVKLTVPGNNYSRETLTVTRTVNVAANSTTQVSLFQPCVAYMNDGMAVEIDGARQSEVVRANCLNQRSYYGPFISVLISKSFQEDDFTLEAKGTSSYNRTFNLHRAESPVAEWSANWLGYSRFDGILLTRDEFDTAPVPVRTALWRYVEAGGTLTVTGGAIDVPAEWRPYSRKDGAWEVTHVGFGKCFMTGSRDAPGLISETERTILDSWNDSNYPFEQRKDIESANNVFKVVEGVEIPVRGLFLLMIGFAVLIGPVNLVVLSNWKKRIWILWTVPLFSFLTCIAVFLYSAFAEGWNAKARFEGVTILDETQHRAVTLGWAAYYATLTPGGGAHYNVDSDLMPQWGRRGGYRSGVERAVNMDWSRDQHLVFGWVVSRVPSHFAIRKNETRRERLTVSASDHAGMTVVNGLGAPIRSLYVAREDGIVFSGSDIPAGKEARLQPTSFTVGATARQMDYFRGSFTTDWLGLPGRLTTDRLNFLRHNTYLAELDGCPFIEKGLDDIETVKAESVVFGIMKRDGEEAKP
ncbi:MAG TPA: hypothetical protein PKO06_09525 [Candidatus Ozemobacteraceae bacterium]|nr:hypothetical protein [Candidatus Ozemobacteraceae bacterium]